MISYGFIDIELWRGSQPNALISGRVDAVASVVSDKTGYSGVVTSGTVTTVSGSVNGSVGGNVNGSVGSVVAAVTVGTNGDKSGYTLTAGSYAIATSMQRGDGSVGNGNPSGGALISAVTMAKAVLRWHGSRLVADSSSVALGITIRLTSTTVITGTRGGTTGNAVFEYEINETP